FSSCIRPLASTITRLFDRAAYPEGVRHHSPGSRSAPWELARHIAYPERVRHHSPGSRSTPWERRRPATPPTPKGLDKDTDPGCAARPWATGSNPFGVSASARGPSSKRQLPTHTKALVNRGK